MRKQSSRAAAGVYGYTGTLRANSQALPRRVCTGARVHYEQTVRPCRGGCVRVHRYTMSKKSGPAAAGVYGCTGTLCANSQAQWWRVCTGAPVHYEQTVRPCRGGCVRVHRCTMSKQTSWFECLFSLTLLPEGCWPLTRQWRSQLTIPTAKYYVGARGRDA